MRRTLALLASLASAGPVLAQAVDDTIEVIGTPLGAPLDPNDLAQNVQTASAADIRASAALDLADFLKRDLGSVFVNEAQSNPLQPDVQFRGFVGSPLLGLPQGIAVYQDGVRINEPFGDTVSWALIPESAIERVYLLPGASPLFGLNALGGAIAVHTKTGATSPGTRAEVSGGSFGRHALQAETGGAAGEVNYFVTGAYFEDDGWRNHSPTEAKQVFGNLGWQAGGVEIGASLTYADTDLIGNGAAPEALLARDRRAIFTRPDRTENTLNMLNIVATHHVSATLELTADVYVRSSDIDTLNGDDSDFEECAADAAFICEEQNGEQEIVLDPDGAPIAADDELIGATVNHTTTEQSSAGFSFQAASTADWRGRGNRLAIGASYDEADIDFAANTELGALDPTRLAIPGGVFVGESFTALHAETQNLGVFVSNVISWTGTVALSVAARYNRTDVTLEDQLGGALDGDHDFSRFNPAAGVTYEVRPAVTLYASYSEANRAPSPVELTCADEDDPCRLPNAFLADPPLEQVVAKTFEAGARGTWNSRRWQAGLFRTTNEDDILFISAGALTNEGYFDNVGRTRRDGIEINVSGGTDEALSWSLSYTYLDATFREPFAVPSPNNPHSIGGEVQVAAGDRLPLVPEQLFKAGIRYAIGGRATLAASVFASSSQFFRGDEGNDGEPIDGYALLTVRGDYRVNDNVRLYLSVDNLLDEEYETFGLFGAADEVLGDGFEDPEFVGPGAPRGAWIGVQVSF